MKANTGGEIDPNDVVGRDLIIENLWSVLRQQSAIIVAERRMGKTSIAKKMRHECPSDVVLLYRDVEGVQSPLEFVERVYQDIEGKSSALKKGKEMFRKLLASVAGVEVGGLIKFPAGAAKDWKQILEGAMAYLASHLDGKLVIFVWDELPLMLQKIAAADNSQTTMDLLDTLRGLRQTHRGIRMVFTGSIGLHHVAADLKAAGHMNDATNDMFSFEIPELADVDAGELASRLLTGEKIETDNREATIAAIVEHTNAIPFYIHHVIQRVKTRGSHAAAPLIADIVEEAMVSAQDPWHLSHFRERLTNYYGQERLPVVLKVLDEVASADNPVTFQHILHSIKGSMSLTASPFTDRILKGDEEPLRSLLQLLERDHYLQKEKITGRYQFRFRLIQRWWRLHRNLMP